MVTPYSCLGKRLADCRNDRWGDSMTRFEIEGPLVKTHYLLACFLLLCVPNSSATVFGVVRGVVHDPQHHPINQARVTLQANDSGYRLMADTTRDGEFQFDAVPLGLYTINVDAPGFAIINSTKIRRST